MHMTWKHCKHPANDAGRASQDALQLYTPSHPQKKDTVVSFTSVCEISDKVASIIVCLSVCVWAFGQSLSLPHTHTEMCWRAEVGGGKPYFHAYMTINDHSMRPDWIFIMWPNPPLCWSPLGVSSPTGPQSSQSGLSQGASSPVGTYSTYPWASLPPTPHPAQQMAHMLPLWLICSLQLWAHSIGAWHHEYTDAILYVQYTWIRGNLCVNYCMFIHYMWSFNTDWKVE